jgi:hypothetical protein
MTCWNCRRNQPRDLLTAGRCRPGQDCASHTLIRQARESGNEALARGIERGLIAPGPWWEVERSEG